MIEQLNGTKETVLHTESRNFKLYMNEINESYPPHWHSEMEIIMPLENIYTIILENTKYVLSPYDIIVIPSGASHQLIAPASGRRLIFQVSHAIVREVNGFDSIYNRFFPCAVFRNDGGKETPHAQMIRLLLEVSEEYRDMHPLWEASIHGMIIRFFVIAGRICIHRADSFPGVRQKKQQAYIDTFFSICTYLNDHFAEPLSLESTADMAGFSKSQFIRLFKEYSGTSYYEYLTRRRLMRADILLGEPEYSITEVAMHSGFNSLATFNRVFKAHHHCTPMEYRQQIRRAER